MNDLVQFFHALCRRWCQQSGNYYAPDAIGEWYRVGPWYIVIAKEASIHSAINSMDDYRAGRTTVKRNTSDDWR